jgi:hypothetical protein
VSRCEEPTPEELAFDALEEVSIPRRSLDFEPVRGEPVAVRAALQAQEPARPGAADPERVATRLQRLAGTIEVAVAQALHRLGAEAAAREVLETLQPVDESGRDRGENHEDGLDLVLPHPPGRSRSASSGR